MDDIIAAMREIQEELSLPRAVRTKLDDLIAILEGAGDTRLKASKVISELEELTDNAAVPSFVRSELWNIVSMLEVLS